MKYEIQGTPFPAVDVYLENGQSVVCQSGAMVWQDPNVQMQTNSNGGFGKMLGRLVTGESLFQNTYTAQGGAGSITFSSSMPGNIIPFEIAPGDVVIAQKTAFLASDQSVNFELYFQKRISSGFFGGEGFIMQKFTGNGTLLLEAYGSVIEKVLQPGQVQIIDTGYLVAMDADCSVEVQTIKGVTNVLFGGEGLFNTKVTAPPDRPATIWLQTMPIYNLAAEIYKYIPHTSN
ncbi:MAG: TIGR00266 family protein [Oscillospiraceae bacterium]|nr:TIGR00266 family protein [Oscillospiraceae bacterium]